MMTPFPPKTPMQMRLQAGRGNRRPAAKLSGQVDPAKYLPLHCETGAEVDATDRLARARRRRPHRGALKVTKLMNLTSPRFHSLARTRVEQ